MKVLQRGVATGLGAAGLGAGLMFLLDPQQGGRRRALMRDKCARLAHDSGDFAEKAARDLRNRARGVSATTVGAFRHEPVSDEVLTERVRASLGRHVSHPSALIVGCMGGVCTVSGPVLSHEADRLLRAVRRVRGVEEVLDALERHDTPGDVPALQGEGLLPDPRWNPRTWGPSTRLLVGLGTGLLAVLALRRAL